MDNLKTLFINGRGTDYKISVADTLLKRFMGWMLKKRPFNEGLLLSPCNSIHTFSMRFNIDVVFLDSQNKVLKTEENLPPFKIIFPVKSSCKVLELPPDSIKSLSIKAGNTLQFR
jgi:hypothetical protein